MPTWWWAVESRELLRKLDTVSNTYFAAVEAVDCEGAHDAVGAIRLTKMHGRFDCCCRYLIDASSNLQRHCNTPTAPRTRCGVELWLSRKQSTIMRLPSQENCLYFTRESVFSIRRIAFGLSGKSSKSRPSEASIVVLLYRNKLFNKVEALESLLLVGRTIVQLGAQISILC